MNSFEKLYFWLVSPLKYDNKKVLKKQFVNYSGFLNYVLNLESYLNFFLNDDFIKANITFFFTIILLFIDYLYLFFAGDISRDYHSRQNREESKKTQGREVEAVFSIF